MPNIKFPTDLDRIQTTDDAVVLAADANGVSHNMQVGEMIEHIKEQVPLEELTATVSSQQQTIEQQRNALDLLNAVNSLNSDSLDHLQQLLVENGEALDQAIDNETRLTNLANALQATQAAPALEAEVTEGKVRLAAAITAKGVPASSSDSFVALATKTLTIPQQLNTRTSDFEQIIAPHPYVWNVYTVAIDLMEDKMPDYIPAYMAGYKQRYGTNAFFVGEYYLGYATLELTGADGYLTCDGDFYTIVDGVVTHTLQDGTVETYEAESIIHAWHGVANTMSNRWVAFFYLTDGYVFSNANVSILPRRVVLCGTCALFSVTGENRITDIWVIDTLLAVNGGTTGSYWNPAQVIRGYKTHSSNNIYTSPTNVISIILTDLEQVIGGHLLLNAAGENCVITLPKLKRVENVSLLYYTTDPQKTMHIILDSLEYCYGLIYLGYNNNSKNNTHFYVTLRGMVNWTGGYLIRSTGQANAPKAAYLHIDMPNLETMSGGSLGDSGNNVSNTNSAAILSLNMPKLKRVTTTYLISSATYQASCTLNCDVEFPELEEFNFFFASYWGIMNECTRIYMPKLRRARGFTRTGEYFLSDESQGNSLIDVVVGELETSINFTQLWRATKILTSYDQTKTLISNIRAHIFERISDRSGIAALTIQFSFTAKLNAWANGTEEQNTEIQSMWAQLKSDFTNVKNWNIA